MIELLPETKDNVIAIRMSGTVTEEDQSQCFEQAEPILNAERVEHLLLDWSDLDGWAKGARTTGTWFGMHHRAMVARVAIVTDEKWADEVLRITDIFNAAMVRRFSPQDRQAALDWIREA
jgi:hypothetical protein